MLKLMLATSAIALALAVPARADFWSDAGAKLQGVTIRGVSESTFKGTQADGSRIEARMVDVFTFKDGKILIKNAYRKNRPAQPAR